MRKMFFAVFSRGRMVFETYAYPFKYFWRCKIDVLLPLILRMISLIWFSSKVRKCFRSTASPVLNLQWIPGTSNIVERLFSRAKLTVDDRMSVGNAFRTSLPIC